MVTAENLPGALLFSLLVGALLSVPVTALLLGMFRRATHRLMDQAMGHGGRDELPKVGRISWEQNPIALQIVYKVSAQADNFQSKGEAIYRQVLASNWSTVMVYCLGGFIFAIILTVGKILGSQLEFTPGRFLGILIPYLWSLVVTLMVVVATNSKERWLAVVGYLGFILLVWIYGVVRQSSDIIIYITQLWLLYNALPSLLLLAFLRRSVRAVGPLVFAFMVFGVTGIQLLITLLGMNNYANLRGLVEWSNTIGVPNTSGGVVLLFILILAVGFLALAIPGWWLLRWLGRQYQAKKINDQSLLADSIFFLFANVYAIDLLFHATAWYLVGWLAFGVFLAVTRIFFTRFQKRIQHAEQTPQLLLLRVFSLGQRSERLYDALSKRWRRYGFISLIAGPDLLTTVVQPYEFLDFIAGKLGREFVKDEADLNRRVTNLDDKPDPDGLFRVNQFYCHADTWKMTMQRLALESEAVLMDLRSFSQTNKGCLFEIKQLLDHVDLERVTFLVDETTDRPFLEQKLQELWLGVETGSPNMTAASPTAHVYLAETHAPMDVKGLMHRLLSASA